MPWTGTITEGGAALLAQWTGGRTLTITRAAAGTGTASGSLSALTALTDQRQEASIVANEAVSTGRRLTIQITPPATSYELNQIGVWGKLDSGSETLLAVYQIENGTEIPDRGTIPDFTYTFYALLNFSNDGGDLTVEMDTSALLTVSYGDARYVPKEDTRPASLVDVVSYTAETRTEAEKATARSNIGAASQVDVDRKPDALKSLTTLHVAKTGNDTTGDGTEAKPYLTIQKAINTLPKVLLDRAKVVVHAGTYAENVVMQHFVGVNDLLLEAAAGETVKLNTLSVEKCTLTGAVYLKNLELVGNSGDGYNYSLLCSDCFSVVLDGIKCTEAVASSYFGAVRFLGVQDARVRSTTVSNKAVALDVIASAVYLNNTVTGADNTVAIRCGSGWGNYGGYVQKGGANIAGEEQKGFGGQIW